MAIEKTLEIQKAKEGESLNVNNDIYTYDDFKKELGTINRVTDIFDKDKSRIKIKQDGVKYIFNIDNEDKFSVKEADMKPWLRQFCEDNETRKAEESVLIRITGLKIEYIKSTTKSELSTLKDDIEKEKNLEIKEADIETVKFKMERSITFLEKEKKDAEERRTKADKIDKNLRKAYESQIQDRLDRLYTMKKEVELLGQNKDKKYTIDREDKNGKKEFKEVKMDDINGFDMKETCKQISVRLEEI